MRALCNQRVLDQAASRRVASVAAAMAEAPLFAVPPAYKAGSSTATPTFLSDFNLFLATTVVYTRIATTTSCPAKPSCPRCHRRAAS